LGSFFNVDYSNSERGAVVEAERLLDDLLFEPKPPNSSPTGLDRKDITSQIPFPEVEKLSTRTPNSTQGSLGAPKVKYENLLDMLPIDLRYKVDMNLEGEAQKAVLNHWYPENFIMQLARSFSNTHKLEFQVMLPPIEGLGEFGPIAYLLSARLHLRGPPLFNTQEPSKGHVYGAVLLGQTYFISGRIQSTGAYLRQIMERNDKLIAKEDYLEATRVLGEDLRSFLFQEKAEDVLISCATESQRVLGLYHVRTVRSLRSLGVLILSQNSMVRPFMFLK
jgi:hypothetical protein